MAHRREDLSEVRLRGLGQRSPKFCLLCAVFWVTSDRTSLEDLWKLAPVQEASPNTRMLWMLTCLTTQLFTDGLLQEYIPRLHGSRTSAYATKVEPIHSQRPVPILHIKIDNPCSPLPSVCAHLVVPLPTNTLCFPFIDWIAIVHQGICRSFSNWSCQLLTVSFPLLSSSRCR